MAKFIVLLLAGFTLLGQNYNFTNYNYSHGLGNSNISSFALDSLGYLWLGSPNGLSLFDGNRFKEFNVESNSTNGIIGTYISDIEVGANGQVYIACDFDGISIYDHSTKLLSNIKSADGILFDKIAASSIYPVNDSLIIIGTYQGGIYKMNPLTKVTTPIAFDDSSYDLTGDPKNKEFVYISGEHLWRLDLRTYEVVKLAEKGGFGILLDEDGKIWTKDYYISIHRFDPETGVQSDFQILDFDSDASRGFIYRNGEIWVGKDNGIRIFNITTHQWRHLISDASAINGMPSPINTGMYIDPHNRLWIGNAKGLSLIDPWDQHFSIIEELGKEIFVNVVPMEEDAFLLPALYLNQIAIWDAKNENVKWLKSTEIFSSEKYILDIIKDKDKFWIKHRNGLNEFNPKLLSISQPFNGKWNRELAKNDHFIIHHDAKDNLYFTSNSTSQLFRISLSGETSDTIEIPFMKSLQKVNGIVVYDEQVIYAYGKYGISKFSFDKKTEPAYYEMPGSSFAKAERDIQNMVIQGDQFWVIKARSSIWRGSINNGNLTFEKEYFEEDGLGDSRATDLIVDAYGKLFVSTLSGLSVYHEGFDGFVNYSQNDGLIDNKIYNLKLIGDSLFILGEGVQLTDVKDFGVLPDAIKVRIAEIQVQGSRWNEKKELNLPYDKNDLKFHFIAIHLNDPMSVSYRCRISDVNEWTYLPYDVNFSEYSDLAPGNYVFEISVKNKYMGWSPSQKVPFTITQPFWKSTWFLLTIMMVISGILYLIFRYREMQLKKINVMESEMAELEKVALRSQMNPHFIFNSLNSIKSYIIHNDRDSAADYLTSFSELIRLILSNSRNKFIPLRDELEALKLYMDIENKRLNSKFDIKIELHPSLDIQKLLIPPLTLQPFVENAIWHGLIHKEEKGSLHIIIDSAEKYLVCTIRDNGVGRIASAEIEKKHKRHRSFGILITGQRISQIKDGFDKDSTNIEIVDLYDDKGKAIGTEVRIRLPVRN